MADPMELLAAPFETGELTLPEPGGLAVLRARPTRAFAPDALVCEQGFKPLHDALAAEGREVHPRLPADRGPFPMAAAALVRAKAENRANFARAWALTRPGGVVLAAGAKTDGVESLQKDLRRLGLAVTALPRRHGRAIWVGRGGAPAQAGAAFAEWRELLSPRPRVTGPDGRAWITCAGVFCWDRIDSGSRLLAEAMPELSGAVADLGAGWGYLGEAILRQPAVERLDAVEAELSALDCARANLDDPRAALHWADATRAPLPAGGHDWVVTNPPFHQGRAASPALGEAFLRAGARLLKPGGRLVAVANRTLPYERVLEEMFAEVHEIARDPGYKVLLAARPRQAARRGGRA
ncbi:MAG: class I SAM-dependent methyltransferase [Pseudomonadota bacterium]